MREWDRFCRLIGLFVGTGYLRGVHAASALFVGDPGSGKSSAILRFANFPTCMVISDLTVEPFRKDVLPMSRDKGYRHLLFPDFWKLFQRKDAAVGNVIGLLSAFMSGELDRVWVGDQKDRFPNVQGGIIGAIPTKIFGDWQRGMEAQGVLDRVIVFPWDFSKEEKMRIEMSIANGDRSDLGPYDFHNMHALHPVLVKWNEKLTPLLIEFVDSIKKERRNRLVGMLRALTMSAQGLYGQTHGWPEPYTATRDALDFVASYGDYFRDAAI